MSDTPKKVSTQLIKDIATQVVNVAPINEIMRRPDISERQHISISTMPAEAVFRIGRALMDLSLP
jgi:hypothetical protein